MMKLRKTMKRRDFVRCSAGAAVMSGFAAGVQADPLSKVPRKPKPRAIVQICLTGGLDAILSTDPKERTEVDQRVDVPYLDSDLEIVSNRDMRYGPLISTMFGKHAKELTFVNGVRCSTVAHEIGIRQNLEMRRQILGVDHTTFGMALASCVNPDAPLQQVLFDYSAPATLQEILPYGRTLALTREDVYLSKPQQRPLNLLARLNATTSAGEKLRKLLLQEYVECGRLAGCAPLDAARRLLTQWPKEPLPAIEPQKRSVPEEFANSTPEVRYTEQVEALEVREILYLLRHRITPSIYWRAFSHFDSHVDNVLLQKRGALLNRSIERLLTELKNTEAIDGTPLSEEVLVVVSSELGRFPFLNSWNGKDHLPELPLIMWGAGMKPGIFGETDRLMRGLPVSPKTGRSSGKNLVRMNLDDVAVTLFNMFGIEDTRSLAYPGRRLDFLINS